MLMTDGVEGRPSHELHRDPQHAVGLDAEAVHVRSKGVIELRGQDTLENEHSAGPKNRPQVQ